MFSVDGLGFGSAGALKEEPRQAAHGYSRLHRDKTRMDLESSPGLQASLTLRFNSELIIMRIHVRELLALVLLTTGLSRAMAQSLTSEVVEVGADYRVVEVVRSDVDAQGDAYSVTNRYTEVATGLNYW